MAKANRVDFVLLGGDLFHHNKPSRATLVKASDIFRRYCLGDDPIRFEVVSDQSINFPDSACVNYEDPNFNIGLPVFSIHGNHDDPSGVGSFSAMDLLGRCNLVNYFGKADNVSDIKIFPILMQKGSTKLALYGLGSVRDERLHRTFRMKKVQWIRPLEEKDDFFNLFVIHQNRTRRSEYVKNAISEQMLPEFLDMVLWGHEHECKIEPTESAGRNYYVCQPGSSVATSLCAGEAVEKNVGILEIRGDEYRLIPKKLKSVRPFKIKDVSLSAMGIRPDDVALFLEAQVEELLEEVREEQGGELSNLTMPLIRIRVECTGYKKLSPSRFGQKFVGKVANHDDILLFFKKAAPRGPGAAGGKRSAGQAAGAAADALLAPGDDGKAPPIHDLIRKHLRLRPNDSVLAGAEMGDAVHSFVDKMEKDAILDFIDAAVERRRRALTADVSIRNAEDVRSRLLGELAEAGPAAEQDHQDGSGQVPGLEPGDGPRGVNSESAGAAEHQNNQEPPPRVARKRKASAPSPSQRPRRSRARRRPIVLDDDEDIRGKSDEMDADFEPEGVSDSGSPAPVSRPKRKRKAPVREEAKQKTTRRATRKRPKKTRQAQGSIRRFMVPSQD